jgi:hypothetical protein
MIEKVTIFLTKHIYIQNHTIITRYINRKKMENYIRTMIRQDNEFVFEQLLKENWRRWVQMKKYYYRTCIYLNYLYFLESYCLDNQSEKCRKKIMDLIVEQGISKNQHKKNIVTYIRWNK